MSESYRVRKLVIGKGRTVSHEQNGEWTKEYYELEIEIPDESELTVAKEGTSQLLDGWLGIAKPEELEQKAEVKARIPEERFTVLRWQDEKGSKLGSFQAAYKSHNLPEKWSHAFNVLKANNSLIASPLHEEGYEFRYWIYPQKYEDRIFRKKLSEAKGQ